MMLESGAFEFSNNAESVILLIIDNKSIFEFDLNNQCSNSIVYIRIMSRARSKFDVFMSGIGINVTFYVNPCSFCFVFLLFFLFL